MILLVETIIIAILHLRNSKDRTVKGQSGNSNTSRPPSEPAQLTITQYRILNLGHEPREIPNKLKS